MRRHVGDDQPRSDALAAGELDAGDATALDVHALDLGPRAHLPAERAQVSGERLGEPPGAALRAGPADGVAHEVQVRGRDRAAGAVRRDVAVHRRAVEPGARAVGAEQVVGERVRRHQQQSRPIQRAAQPQRGEQLEAARQRREAAEQRVAPGAEVLEIGRRETPPGVAVPRLQARRAKRRSRRGRGRGRRRARRAAGARSSSAGAPSAGRGARAASGRTRARPRWPGRPPRTCHAGSRGGSAPRSPPRRRCGRRPPAPSRARPASASVMAAASPFGPLPTTSARSLTGDPGDAARALPCAPARRR